MTNITATPPESGTAPASPRLPGDLAIWFFIMAEMLAFAVFFASYAFARANNVEMFNAYQQTLDRNAGALNTVLLITGSWFVVLAVQAAHRDDQPAVPRNILLGFLCGGGFLVVKVFEYAAKFGAGISMSTNTFYMFYISLTFFHFMHVILGMVILSVLWKQSSKGPPAAADQGPDRLRQDALRRAHGRAPRPPLYTVACHDDLTAADLVGRHLIRRAPTGRRPAHPRRARRRHLLPR
jgi:nitric oxide reductase NorE protein